MRDLVENLLTPAEFLRRPMTKRSRWLITGFDEEIGCNRQFYLGSSAEYRSPGLLRVALYEPGGRRPAYAISRPFGETRAERTLMATAVASWSQRDLEDLELRIYDDDLKLLHSSTGIIQTIG